MKNFLIIPVFLFCLFLSGCDSEKPAIAFSKTPFTKEMGYIPCDTFKTGERIYYAVYNPKGFKTRLLKLQVFKKDNSKSEFWAYSYLYNKTLELKDKRAYTDYIVINGAGAYIFQIFDFTDLQEPVILGIINVK